MNSRTIRWGLISALILPAIVILAACSTTGSQQSERTSREWYEEGIRLMEKKRYQGAVEALEEAAVLYRDAALDADIQLALGEAHFRKKDYEGAVAAYGEFLRLHPRHRSSGKAQYQIAMSYFKQMRGPDRSQEATHLALEAFEKLIRSYPRSELVPSAREKIVLCRRRLADHEIYVGRYYLRTKAYGAALPRFDKVYHEFSDLGFGDDALYYLGVCYQKLNDTDNARKMWELLMQEYPHSRFLEEIEEGEG
jgi:outer membrane protein assembly factor BamD